MIKVLVACEESATVREAFKRHGADAWSCDVLPSRVAGQHYEGRLEDFIGDGSEWDLIIAHPPCTYLANSGVRWLTRDKSGQRWTDLGYAIAFFNMIKNRNCPYIAIENPIPHKYARQAIGAYDQIIHPWQFGHPESKATCLWLKGLPPLVPTSNVKAEMLALPKSQAQRIHYFPPGKDRQRERSITFSGVAEAMATQWMAYLESRTG